MSFFFQVIFSLCKIVAGDLKKKLIIIFRGMKCGKWYLIILETLVMVLKDCLYLTDKDTEQIFQTTETISRLWLQREIDYALV